MQSFLVEHTQVSPEATGITFDFGFIDEINNLKVMYGVYVVEQDGKTPFNRAMLMNVGAAEAVKQQVFIILVLCFFFTLIEDTGRK